MGTLIWLVVKLALQLVLIAWWGCQLAVYYSVRAARTIHARHIQYVRAQQIGATANERPHRTEAPAGLGDQSDVGHRGATVDAAAGVEADAAGDWLRLAAGLTERTAVDLARANMEYARSR